jgi:hypothetical protein
VTLLRGRLGLSTGTVRALKGLIEPESAEPVDEFAAPVVAAQVTDDVQVSDAAEADQPCAAPVAEEASQPIFETGIAEVVAEIALPFVAEVDHIESPADAVYAEDLSDDTLFNAPLIDEDILHELVGQIVRDELQGQLGERITRSIRKLVRTEVARALSARELL